MSVLAGLSLMVYLSVVFIMALGGSLHYFMPYNSDQRAKGARYMLGSPVWPIIAIVLLPRGAVRVVRAALGKE